LTSVRNILKHLFYKILI